MVLETFNGRRVTEAFGVFEVFAVFVVFPVLRDFGVLERFLGFGFDLPLDLAVFLLFLVVDLVPRISPPFGFQYLIDYNIGIGYELFVDNIIYNKLFKKAIPINGWRI